MDSQSSYAWLCQQIVTETPDAIIFADPAGIIRLWNRGAEEIFGHSAGEAVGQPLDLIIPEALRERHDQGYRRVMATGRTHYGRELLAVPGLRRDGGRVSLEFSITLLRGDDGRLAGVAAILRDVSVRRQQDQELKKRLAHLEAELAKRSS